MVKYTLRRLLYIIFVMAVISVIMFSIYKLTPGDPALIKLGGPGSLKPEAFQILYEKTRLEMGLDKHVVIQYFSWMGNILTGDFGYSTTYNMSVSKVIVAPMQNTVKLNIIGLILVFLITIPLGIRSAVKKNSIFDSTVLVVTILGYSLPVFVFALIFIYFFAIRLNLFPISGTGTVGFYGTGFAKMLDSLKYMALPLLTYVFASLGSITRYVRASMIDALRMDYIRTARAKGLREKVVIYSHALRNSMIPIVTIMTGAFIGIFSGSVMIERIYSWNGMGQVMLNALNQRDFNVVFTINLFYALLALLGNLIMDLTYGFVDPRVKLS